MKLGAVLKQLRNDKGLTQDELAQKLSLAKSTISLYEADKREPDSEILKRMADYFNVSIDYLLGHSESKNSVIFKHDGKEYKIIGDSGDITEEEWKKITDSFETIVAGIKAQREK